MDIADPGDRAVYVIGLKQRDSWDRGFESSWGNKCSSLVLLCVVDAAASATSWRLVKSSTASICVCVCVCVCARARACVRACVI